MTPLATADPISPELPPVEKRPLMVVLGLDVEEEGLFGGHYACHTPNVRNTAALERLAPLLERGVRPTLFCAHSVFTDAASRRILVRLRDIHGAEIGAHLHHWNTPPLAQEVATAPGGMLTRVPAGAVPDRLMAAKLATLFRTGAAFQDAPLTSFRMGRWDLHTSLWPLLEELGVRCDASVRPLHCGKAAAGACDDPDHFDAPADPYWVGGGATRLLEMPLTVTPLFSWLPRLVRAFPGNAGAHIRAGLRHWGVLALLPVQHPLSLLRLTTLLHAARGGRVLSLTWHSSELFPGGAPHVPDEATVRRFMDKMLAYVDWLDTAFAVQFLTLEELRQAAERDDFRVGTAPPDRGDWTRTAKMREKKAMDTQKPDAAAGTHPWECPAPEGHP